MILIGGFIIFVNYFAAKATFVFERTIPFLRAIVKHPCVWHFCIMTLYAKYRYLSLFKRNSVIDKEIAIVHKYNRVEFFCFW